MLLDWCTGSSRPHNHRMGPLYLTSILCEIVAHDRFVLSRKHGCTYTQTWVQCPRRYMRTPEQEEVQGRDDGKEGLRDTDKRSDGGNYHQHHRYPFQQSLFEFLDALNSPSSKPSEAYLLRVGRLFSLFIQHSIFDVSRYMQCLLRDGKLARKTKGNNDNEVKGMSVHAFLVTQFIFPSNQSLSLLSSSSSLPRSVSATGIRYMRSQRLLCLSAVSSQCREVRTCQLQIVNAHICSNLGVHLDTSRIHLYISNVLFYI